MSPVHAKLNEVLVITQIDGHQGRSGKHGWYKAEFLPDPEVAVSQDPLSTADTASSFYLPSHMPAIKLLPSVSWKLPLEAQKSQLQGYLA